MNAFERKSAFTLSIILALRMLGLFMALPLFSLYALHLKNASPQLVGLAIGVYGLTQALFQIPLGTSSDYFGRKKVITLGLLLFVSGSILIALSTSIQWVIVGRALQGAGAIGSTVIALLSDLIREDERGKAIAFIGMTIGISFSSALILGPTLMPWIGFNGIFWLAALFGLIALYLLHTAVPNPASLPQRQKLPMRSTFLLALLNRDLIHLYFGIFILHFIFTANFMALPLHLKNFIHLAGNHQWHIYLPALILGFCLSIFFIVIAEKKRKIKMTFFIAVTFICAANILLCLVTTHIAAYLLAMLLFFTGFSTLEALLPSTVSRLALSTNKGSALGIYSCSQFSGIFVGGLAGGWLIGHDGTTSVYLVSLILGMLWMLTLFGMKKLKSPQAVSSSPASSGL
ncbi:MAG: MFS transporter [Gammaproteobacteria bacterium]|nr:MFS transporter [Gammaproteobacteria bacterium]